MKLLAILFSKIKKSVSPYAYAKLEQRTLSNIVKCFSLTVCTCCKCHGDLSVISETWFGAIREAEKWTFVTSWKLILHYLVQSSSLRGRWIYLPFYLSASTTPPLHHSKAVSVPCVCSTELTHGVQVQKLFVLRTWGGDAEERFPGVWAELVTRVALYVGACLLQP